MVSGRDDRPYFFLSYARTPKRDPADRDSPDRWVHKLYRDLCDAILQMTDARPEEAGFMDVENKVGAEWSPELIDAMPECRVFVPLYSRRYFESANCGREWFAFARREVTHRARGGERVDAIVPALWTRLDRRQMPAIAQTFRCSSTRDPAVSDTARTGFYGLMKLRNLPRGLPAGGAPSGRADHRGRRGERSLRRTTAQRRAWPPKGLRIAAPVHSGRPARGGRRTGNCRSRCSRTTRRRCRRGVRPTITVIRRDAWARTGRTIPSRWPNTPRN